jgi:hypothetical protein
LDFVNGRYFAGGVNTTLADIVGGSPSCDSSGLLCNATNFAVRNAALTALQARAVSTVIEVSGGKTGVNAGLLGQSANAPLFQASNNRGRNYRNTSSKSLDTAAIFDWTKVVVLASSNDASGRAISANGCTPASDTFPYSSPSSAVLGSYNGTWAFGGRMRSFAVVPRKLTGGEIQQLSSTLVRPSRPSYGHCAVSFGYNQYLNAGAILPYERTQAWSCIAGIRCPLKPGAGFASLIFGKCNSGVPFRGYELWINDAGKLQVRIISNFGSKLYLGVSGSTVVTDDTRHVVGATYDGSGRASGVKLYVDGSPELLTVERDTLGANTTVSRDDFIVGNQLGGYADGFYLKGIMDMIQMSDMVRNATYYRTYASARPPVDGSHTLAYDFTEDSGESVADRSRNGYVGSLSHPNMWIL